MSANRRHLSEIPLLFPAIGMAMGIALPVSVDSMPIWGWFAVIVIAILAGMLLKRPRLVLSLLAALLGYAAMLVAAPDTVSVGAQARVRGVVIENSDYGTLQRLVVRESANRRYAVSLYDYKYTVEEGDSVCFAGWLLPAVRETSVPDENNGAHYALTCYISAGVVPTDGNFEITSEAGGVRGWLNRVRNSMLELIRYSGLSQPAANFLSAILLGEDAVDSDLRREFSQAGLSHVLALSGTHVSVIALLIAILFFPVEMAGSRRSRIVLTIVLLWGFAVLTGMSPSVVRAVVMATFLLIGRALGRATSSFNSLCAAAMFILLFDPAAIFMPGFQLSFCAVIGIMLFMPMVQEWLLRFRLFHQHWAMATAQAVALPIAAVVATGPLAALHFHSFPIWFLLANLPIAVLLPLVLIGGVILLVLTGMNIGAGFLADTLTRLYELIATIAEQITMLPGNNSGGGLYFSAWILLPLYGAIFLLWLSWNNGSKASLYRGMILLIASLLLLPIARGRYAQRETFAWHEGKAVGLICREGERVYLVTDAAPKYYPEIEQRLNVRLKDYLGKRSAKFMGIVADSLSLPNIEIRKAVWHVNGNNYYLLRDSVSTELKAALSVDDTERRSAGVDYLVVSSGFRGDILAVAELFPNDTIILSASLPPQRRRRYAAQLREATIPYTLNLHYSGVASKGRP
jgi:ComEC/Rec2-related protein